MEPRTPSEKIMQPREFAEREGARLNEAESEPLRMRDADDSSACAFCGGDRSVAALTSFGEYHTAQRELLASFLVATHPGLDLGGRFHAACLEHAERDLQRAQLDCTDHVRYIDLTLGSTPILSTPILSTPIRMNADLRFSGRGVTIAFVDSGFYPHPDLIFPSHRIIAMYDAVRGRELLNIARLINTPPPVQAWHGTMAAATAAGSGFQSGGMYRGIASDARLVLVRAMTPRYHIRTPQVVRALTWIRDNHRRLDIRVVNLSLGVDETTDSMEHPVIALVEELVARGVVVVAASGNNPSNPIKPPGAAPSAITVGGYNDHNSTEWMHRELWHSSYGRTPGGSSKPDLLAPAIWVAAPILPLTEVKTEADALFRLACASDEDLMRLVPMLAPRTHVERELDAAAGPVYARSIVLARIAAEKLITTEYKHVDGTSFAAPIVSSVVAQMLEARPQLTPGEVKEILCATAVLLADASAAVQGHGLVAPDRALDAVMSLPPGAGEREPRATTGGS